MKLIKTIFANALLLSVMSCGEDKAGPDNHAFRSLGTLEDERANCYASPIANISSDEVRARCNFISEKHGETIFSTASLKTDACKQTIQIVLYSCMAQIAPLKITNTEIAVKYGTKCFEKYQPTIEKDCGQFRF